LSFTPDSLQDDCSNDDLAGAAQLIR